MEGLLPCNSIESAGLTELRSQASQTSPILRAAGRAGVSSLPVCGLQTITVCRSPHGFGLRHSGFV